MKAVITRILLVMLVITQCTFGYGQGKVISSSTITNLFAHEGIFMSPKGMDTNKGTFGNPVKSFEKARELVRIYKEETSEDIVVYLREGRYFIDKTIVLGIEDGGEGIRQIIWQAYRDEIPVISSGINLQDWKKSGRLKDLPPQAMGNVYEASLPENVEIPRCLFKGDEMLKRSRMKGFKSRIDAFNRDGLGKLRSFNIMYVDDQAVLKDWKNVMDLELVIRPWCLWTMNNLPIESIDVKNRTIKTQVEGTYFLTKERYNRFPNEHAWIENSLEGMTEPGTWCANSLEGKVYYWPKNGIPGNDIYLPVLQEFIRIEGENDLLGKDDIPVKGLVFKGLTFKHNDRYDFEESDAGIQHDWELFDKDNSFFRFRGAEDCVIEECEFTAGGGVGIRLDLYCKNIKVRNNYIHGIGSTGIFLGGYGLGTKDVNTKNIITNNKIADAARLYWHSTGVTVSQSSENLISHNEISSMPYSGMVITGYRPWFMHESRKNFIDGKDSLMHYNWHGGDKDFIVGLWIRENSRSVRWDEIGGPLYGPAGSSEATWDSLGFLKIVASFQNMNHNRQNIIEYNEIYDVMNVLGDGNGIYISDAGPFNVIRYNFIHNAPKAWGVGIRTDAFQMNTMVFGNIIWKFSGGIATSANNMAYNNIVASCRDMGFAEEPGKHLDFYFDYKSTTSKFSDGFVMRNVIWHDGNLDPYFRLNIAENQKPDNVVDYNFYFWKDHQDKMKDLLTSLQNLGIDRNSKLFDPMFRDPAAGNFTILPGSPLLNNGFVSIDQSKMGLTDSFPLKSRITKKLSLPLWISDKMIIPSEINWTLRGSCGSFQEVSVSFDEMKISTKANKDGIWEMNFPPVKPGISGDMVFECNGKTKVINDALSGKIWLCAGQSNMAMQVKSSNESVEAGNDVADCEIRYFNGNRWLKVTEENVQNISAVAFFFAVEIEKRQKNPVGIFVTARGGTGIEAWIPKDAFPNSETGNRFKTLVDDSLVLKAAREDKEDMKPYGQHRLAKWGLGRAVPASLFDELIRPFGQLPVTGVIWYQGESNTENINQATEYRFWLENLISSYRKLFNKPDLPFAIIQLPVYDPGTLESRKAWKILQGIQATVANNACQTVLVNIQDLGDLSNIHPSRKKEVGVRAAKAVCELIFKN